MTMVGGLLALRRCGVIAGATAVGEDLGPIRRPRDEAEPIDLTGRHIGNRKAGREVALKVQDDDVNGFVETCHLEDRNAIAVGRERQSLDAEVREPLELVREHETVWPTRHRDLTESLLDAAVPTADEHVVTSA